MSKIEIAHGFTTDMVYAIAGTFTGGLSSKGFKLFLSEWYNVKKIVPIVDTKEQVEGEKTYKHLADVPEKIDVVIVVHKPAITKRIVEEATKLPYKPAIWFMPRTDTPESIALCEVNGLKYAKSCMMGHRDFKGLTKYANLHFYHSELAGFNRISKQRSIKKGKKKLEIEKF